MICWILFVYLIFCRVIKLNTSYKSYQQLINICNSNLFLIDSYRWFVFYLFIYLLVYKIIYLLLLLLDIWSFEAGLKSLCFQVEKFYHRASDKPYDYGDTAIKYYINKNRNGEKKLLKSHFLNNCEFNVIVPLLEY